MNCAPCNTVEHCGQTPCEALEEIGLLLPRGNLWTLNDGTYSLFWHAVADIKSQTQNAICAEWMELNPCTSSRTLERWARFYKFPLECVDLTQPKLCEWIELLNDCPPLSEGFIPKLFEFVGIGGIDLTIPKSFAQLGENCGCETNDNCEPCCSDNVIIITAPKERFTCEEICWDECLGNLEQVMNQNWDCEYCYIPEIECLRRYFPLGYDLCYVSQCADAGNIFAHRSWKINN